MKRFLTPALMLVAATAAHAQTRDQPNLTFAIMGGLTTGSNLWSVSQPVPAPQGQQDTLNLGRRLRPGLVAGLSATFYRSAHVGYVLEAGYFGLGSEGRCSVEGGSFKPDLLPQTDEHRNEQACLATQGEHYPTSVTGFLAGVSFRGAPAGRLSPYLTVSGGLGVLGNSFIETNAVILAPNACSGQGSPTCTLGLLAEGKHASITWVASLAAGTSVRFGQGYRLRLEARDLMTSIPIVTGPGGPNAAGPPVAETGRLSRHVFVLTAGLEVILERSHRRRY